MTLLRDRRCDTLVIGGGPSGAGCAYWLASAGHDVVLVERKAYPREKTCGDALTPRAVRQLEEMGLGGELGSAGHRVGGLRSHAFGRTLELAWPEHPEMPDHGYVITRKDLDALVAERAGKAGASVWDRAEALAPIVENGLVRGAVIGAKDGSDERANVRARYVVVADGASSRFGRALGTHRERAYPLGMAIRGYWPSPRHAEGWIDSWLDLRDKADNVLPGYGWIFPVGDGRVNVGVGLLSTFHQWKAVNTTHLLESFVETAPESWGVRPDTRCGPPTGGRLPMGLSVRPHIGPTYLVAGDAGGAINPFNGEGIAYAYETGRMAAEAVHTALASGDGLALQMYPARLLAEYGLYYKTARLFVRVIGHPELMRRLVATGMRSRSLMEWVLRIMANLIVPDEFGAAEAAYRAVAAVAKRLPEAA